MTNTDFITRAELDLMLKTQCDVLDERERALRQHFADVIEDQRAIISALSKTVEDCLAIRMTDITQVQTMFTEFSNGVHAILGHREDPPTSQSLN